MIKEAGGGCLLIVAGLFGVLILSWLLVFASFGIKVATAGLVGRGNAHIQINSAANRIQAYEHFFNLCAAVQTDEAAIDALTKELSTADEDDRSRIQTNLTANHIARANSIATYNADANKSYNAGQFRDSDLPYQLNTSEYIAGGTKTVCAIDY